MVFENCTYLVIGHWSLVIGGYLYNFLKMYDEESPAKNSNVSKLHRFNHTVMTFFLLSEFYATNAPWIENFAISVFYI